MSPITLRRLQRRYPHLHGIRPPPPCSASLDAFVGIVVGSVVVGTAIGVGVALLCRYGAFCCCSGGSRRARHSGAESDDGSLNEGEALSVRSGASTYSFIGKNDTSSGRTSTDTSEGTASWRETDGNQAGSGSFSEYSSASSESECGGGGAAGICGGQRYSGVKGNIGDAFDATRAHGYRYEDGAVEISIARVTPEMAKEEEAYRVNGGGTRHIYVNPENLRGSPETDLRDAEHSRSLAKTRRSMLTEVSVNWLYVDKSALLQAANSIRYHQSQGMSEDESVLLHLYRHSATSDPAFGPFIEDAADSSSS